MNEQYEKIYELVCNNPYTTLFHDETDAITKSLLKHGMIMLPCKPGQVMYRLNTRHGVVVTFVVDGVLVHNDYMVICDEEYNTFSDEDIGKKLFYTKEEAEAALGKRDAK